MVHRRQARGQTHRVRLPLRPLLQPNSCCASQRPEALPSEHAVLRGTAHTGPEEMASQEVRARVERGITAYLLDHEYTAANLKEGLDGLKGVDAHRVTLLGPIAEQLDFVVGLASLSHKVSGCADDYGHGYRGRTPSMVEVIKKSTSISGFVDLTGASLLPVKTLNLSDESLIPGNPFKGKKPDDAKYEGYLGNVGFHLSLLVLITVDVFFFNLGSGSVRSL